MDEASPPRAEKCIVGLKLHSHHRLVLRVEHCSTHRPGRLGSLRGDAMKYVQHMQTLEEEVSASLHEWRDPDAQGSGPRLELKVNSELVIGQHPSADAEGVGESSDSFKRAWPALPPSPAGRRPASAGTRSSESVLLRSARAGEDFSPRLGAFEVAFEFYDDSFGTGHPSCKTSGFLHSKLQSSKWPNMSLLLQRLRRALTEYLVGPIDNPLPFAAEPLPAVEDQSSAQLRANLNKLHDQVRHMQYYSETWWHHSCLPLPPRIEAKASTMLDAAQAEARRDVSRNDGRAQTAADESLDALLIDTFGADESVLNLQMELGKQVFSMLLKRARAASAATGVDKGAMERAFCKVAMAHEDAVEVMSALLRESPTLLTDVLAATAKRGVRREDGFIGKMAVVQSKQYKLVDKQKRVEATAKLKQNEMLRGILELQEQMDAAEAAAASKSASEVVTGVCPKWFDATRATPSARKDPSYICVSANLASSPPHESVVRAALSGTLQLRETEVKQVSLTQHTADATKLRASCAILCDDETKCSSVFKKLQQVEAKVWMALSSLPIDLEHPDIKVQMTSNKTLVFGEMSDLYGGIDQLVGPRADGDVAAAVKKEHTECADSDETFTTSNYKVETTSRTEYEFVHSENGAQQRWPEERCPTMAPDKKRKHKPPSKIKAEMEKINEKLEKTNAAARLVLPEVLCARLYTGPLYEKYNAVLRGLPRKVDFFEKKFNQLCKGNRYTNTLHAINSVLVTLGRITEATPLYFGVSDHNLSKDFTKPDKYMIAGGIEFGFRSATVDKNVALGYLGKKKPGILFKMEQGMLDRGACVDWASQYPYEREVLLPAISGLHFQRADLLPRDDSDDYETDLLQVQVRPAVLGGRQASAVAGEEALYDSFVKKLRQDLPLPSTRYTFQHATQKKASVGEVVVEIETPQEDFKKTIVSGPNGFDFPLHEVPEGRLRLTLISEGFDEVQFDVFHILKDVRPHVGRIVLSPEMPRDSMRVVLVWGKTPRDLDLHCIDSKDQHVFYEKAGQTTGNIQLDCDDTDGEGPETITTKAVEGQAYTFYVHNYSGDGDFASSAAVVTLYVAGSKETTFHLPKAQNACSDISVRYWDLFTVHIGPDGEKSLEVRNKIVKEPPIPPSPGQAHKFGIMAKRIPIVKNAPL
mmetsp:Transcript_3500/g.7457  ORF Transcript_3500/g.7457 Transcript_3500/m.7457 type:complete len:1156 (+) Transcript_3500:3-3470(+)